DAISVLAMPPTSTFKLDAAECSVKLGGGVMVTVSVAVRVTFPPFAVMVNGYAPGVEVPSGANARILVPEPGATVLAGVKLGCRPVGRLPPLDAARDSATGELNPPTSPDMVALTAPMTPCPTVRLFCATLKVKAGNNRMVTGSVRVLVWPPPTALTVKLYVPPTAVEPAWIVSVLVPSPGAAREDGENEVVTPV